jgi:hypothetical protein
MSYKFIVPRKGELYSEACKRVLGEFVSSNGKREELLRRKDVKEAIEEFYGWHCCLKQETFFGREICEEMYDGENRKLINKVLYEERC